VKTTQKTANHSEKHKIANLQNLKKTGKIYPMSENKKSSKRFQKRARKIHVSARIRALQLVFFAVACVLVFKLGYLQITQYSVYEALATGQRDLYKELYPERGDILVKDQDGKEYALATNRYLNLIWADTRRIDDPIRTAKVLSEILEISDTLEKEEDNSKDQYKPPTDNPEEEPQEEEIKIEEPTEPQKTDYQILLNKLSKEDDPYEPLKRKVTDEKAEEVKRANLKGIHILRERFRFYPEAETAGHITGFVSANDDATFTGKYGAEGNNEEILAGTPGFLFSELDARGRWISVGTRNRKPAEDGADILLTIDRTIQYQTCKVIKEAVEEYQADKGSIIILDPNTGAIRALCGYPNFDPNKYNEVETISVYNNQTTFEAYEPGSIFKPIVMAGALDMGAVTPDTIYEDKGEEKIDRFTIQNADHEAHGWQSMTQVLEKSLNTGMIFVMRKMGMENMSDYIHKFGFGEKTGISLDTEVAGNIEAVDKGYEIFSATSSYGQGITITPLQAVSAYGAIANGGILYKPYIIEEIRYKNGETIKTEPKQIRRVISQATSRTISAMMISVVENGHAKKAAVEGYYIAGKTGTAQVASKTGDGYQEQGTIASFVGFGTVSNPKFVALVRIDHPRTSQWSSSTSAPTFRRIADFLIKYDRIPPER